MFIIITHCDSLTIDMPWRKFIEEILVNFGADDSNLYFASVKTSVERSDLQYLVELEFGLLKRILVFISKTKNVSRRPGNNGVSWYPTYQKICGLTENFV